MTERERERSLLLYIRESIDRIERYSAGGKERFLADTMAQDAIVRRLETLADAARHRTDGLKARHPEVRWRAMYGFRNVVAHGYLELDLDRIWDTVEADLPALKIVADEELGRAPPP